MAKATVNLICEQCGAEFTRTKTCYNRREADNWEAYMLDNGGICTECWKAQKRAEREAETAKFVESVYNKLNLPEIDAVSEKQKKYAEDLRVKFAKYAFKPDSARLFDAIYTGRFMTPEKQKELAEMLLKETSARKIIDALKNVV